MTITIPDWLFCGPFWAGFGIAALFAVVVFFIVIRNFNPFGR